MAARKSRTDGDGIIFVNTVEMERVQKVASPSQQHARLAWHGITFVVNSMEVERVQAVASLSKHLGAIPKEFVRPENERPGTTTFHGPDVPGIPVVDLSDRDNVVKAVATASEEWGIFQVVNHGIPVGLIETLQRVGREFFELPQEEKEKYAVGPNSGEGYGTKLHKEPEGKKAWVDYLFHNIWPASQIDYKFWPENPSDYRKVNQEYAKYMLSVMDEMLTSLSRGLGLEAHVLKEALGGKEVELLLKINYYPPCPCPDLALGVVAHTDLSAITLLMPNEVPGLQVFKDGHWINTKYIPNAIIVHIGDQVEILSNGKYKSVLHRTTVNKEKVRMSWPVFCSPPGERVIVPLQQFVSDASPAKYKAKSFKEYKYCKLNMLPQ